MCSVIDLLHSRLARRSDNVRHKVFGLKPIIIQLIKLNVVDGIWIINALGTVQYSDWIKKIKIHL